MNVESLSQITFARFLTALERAKEARRKNERLSEDEELPPITETDKAVITNLCRRILEELYPNEPPPHGELPPLEQIQALRRTALASIQKLKLPTALAEGPLVHMIQTVQRAKIADEANRNLVAVFNKIKSKNPNLLPGLRGTFSEQAETARNWIRDNKELFNRCMGPYALDLDFIEMTALPPEITLPVDLRLLRLNDNPITDVPKNLPPSLSVLCLGGTPIGRQFLAIPREERPAGLRDPRLEGHLTLKGIQDIRAFHAFMQSQPEASGAGGAAAAAASLVDENAGAGV